MTMYDCILELVSYGIAEHLLQPEDRIYTINRLLYLFNLQEIVESAIDADKPLVALEQILAHMLDYASEHLLIAENTIECRDLFDSKIMNCLMMRPSEVIRQFREEYAKSPKAGSDFYYRLSRSSDYIRTYREKRNVKWQSKSKYGLLDITINLAKPEKDPRDIARAKQSALTGYPQCLLCPQNEGYAGHFGYPARDNHRILPVTINGAPWSMQYSPYAYYNEHCILLNNHHVPMLIDSSVFEKLFDFVDIFPHYFVGSNADLPIVGGSILAHEHFQGGCYEFPLERATIKKTFTVHGIDSVLAGIVDWPMSVIRLNGADRNLVSAAACVVMDNWKNYSDQDSEILAVTEEKTTDNFGSYQLQQVPHNTITPIARKKNGQYELDIVLRNNRTTDKYPFGIFHPHEPLHHIKKENIGLIEVMGLAILPSRLKSELEAIAQVLVEETDISQVVDSAIASHVNWITELRRKYSEFRAETVETVLHTEVGAIFEQVLEDCGVFKTTNTGFARFEQFVDTLL